MSSALRKAAEQALEAMDYPGKAKTADEQAAITAQVNQQLLELQEKYNDLLFCVGNKYPGESRHDTAKRYLFDRENFGLGDARAIERAHGIGGSDE